MAPVWPPVIRLPASTRRSEMRPAMRRAHLGPFEIELGLLQRRFGRRDRARRVALRRSPRVELPLGEGLAAHQRRRPLDVVRRDLQPCLRALHVGLGLLDREPIRPRIDDEQKIALLDDLAVLEMNGIDEARDPCAHLDRLHRANRPVYSSHSVIFFCSGRATVTAGGLGAAPAAGLPSQPASRWDVSNRATNRDCAGHGVFPITRRRDRAPSQRCLLSFPSKHCSSGTS